MALFKIFKGQAANLPDSYTDGYCYFTMDDGKMYIDTSDKEEGRVCLNAYMADRLRTARTIKLTGDAIGSTSFNGATNAEIVVDVPGLDDLGEAINSTKEELVESIATKATNGHGIYYGTCTTGASTKEKVASLSDSTGFSLATGSVVIIKFTNKNSVSSPTLNVNSTGAKTIRRYGTSNVSTTSTTNGWSAGSVCIFVYDGTYWVETYWYNTTYSLSKFGQGYGTCTTDANTAEKLVTLSSYALGINGIVSVKFTYAVPAEATLNINTQGAWPIYHKGAVIASNIIQAGDTATFITEKITDDDDTVYWYYHLIAIDRFMIGGTGIVVDGNVINHSNSITAKIKNNQNSAQPVLGGTFKVTEPLYDAQGHITGTNVATITLPNITDDDIILFEQNSNNTYNIKHEMMWDSPDGLSADQSWVYESTNTTTSINGSGASGIIKIPQLIVDNYGHVIHATDEDITITMPTDTGAIDVTVNGGGNAVTGASYDSATRILTLTKGESYALENEVSENIVALQTAINGKQATITGAATTITSDNLTASKVLISNSSGKVAVSDITSTELGYLDGVTSNIQTQLNSKQATITAGDGLAFSGNTLKVGAGSGLTVSANAIGHTNSVTAGTVTEGGSNRTLAFSESFNIPTVAYDSEGHITGTATTQLTLPSDRIFQTLVASGTAIPVNADLNTINYLKVGKYYCSLNDTAKTLSNCPTVTYDSNGDATSGLAFMMEVYSPLSATLDNENTDTGIYRVRILTTHTGIQYIQSCSCGSTVGEWSYGTWKKYIIATNNKAIGSSSKPVYLNSSGNLVACSYSLNNVTQNAVITTNGQYPILLGYDTNTTKIINSVNKTSGLTYNPSTDKLTAGSLLLTSTSTPQIEMSRSTHNYIVVPEEADLCFTIGTASLDGSSAVITSDSIYPGSSDAISLGTNSRLWSNVYATVFTGELDGNAKTSSTWKEVRTFGIGDYSQAHTGDPQQVDGSGDVTLLLPEEFEGHLIGNADTATILKDSRTINGMTFNGSANVTNYGVCGTAAATAAKAVTVGSTFVLAEGAQVVVKFTYANSVASPTLNVNNTGAKPIVIYGVTGGTTDVTPASTSTTVNGWLAGAVQTFTYDGTNWVRDYWYNTTYTTRPISQTAAESTDNAEYPLLSRTTTSTSSSNGHAKFVAGVTLNPSTKTITATTFAGNATSASKLATACTITLAGDLSGSVKFDGSGDVSISAAVLDDSHNHTIANVDNLQTSLNEKLSLTGGTMTGAINTSFKSSTAMGSYGSSATTVEDLVEEIRYSSGAMGSVSIGTAYTAGSGGTIAAGWYNFIYSPHRSGGASGAATGDNHQYGTLILSGMTSNLGLWKIRISSGAIGASHRIWAAGDAVTGAVWNDYAECRESDCIEAGYVLIENGDDSLSKSTERLQAFAGISSDTWGFSQGETNKAKTHIAVAGRVLAYTYQNRNNYKPGDCVCAAPNGTVDIMTREEIINYPDRVIGTVSCIPDYEIWGGGNDRDPVKVNGRIWIKVR